LKTRFLPPAHRELREAIRYYNMQRVLLGEEFRDEVWETIQRVQKFPDAWHPFSESIRRCQMNRFPYGLIYSATKNEIIVVAIAHLHRAPDYWRSRVDDT
jgi:hypothetical protein